MTIMINNEDVFMVELYVALRNNTYLLYEGKEKSSSIVI